MNESTFSAMLLTSTVITVILFVFIDETHGCQFYPAGEYLRFVRVSESLPVGEEVLLVEVHPRTDIFVRPVDKQDGDVDFFAYSPVNASHVSVRLRQSLEELVDSQNPRNVLKFRLICDYKDGDEMVDAYLSVTVYVEDENDHAPEFVNDPYYVSIDELTPTGLRVFRGIEAIDRDKPNTPNSEVSYSIRAGNTGDKFSLEVGHRPALVLKRPLDYDGGDTKFVLQLQATDGGSPPRTSLTTLTVYVTDSDDLNPIFTRDIYKTKVMEAYPITGKRLHQELKFKTPIQAYDQDTGVNASLRYDIVSGNDRGYFTIDSTNGSIFLEREIDLDALQGNVFSLQIQASQRDNPLKTGLARVEVEVVDMNDNQPQFEVELYNISIVENLPNGFSVLQVTARDKDQGDNGEFVYHLVDPAQAFSIDGRTGWLTVRNQAKLDRETRPSLSMRVYAREKMPPIAKQATESFVNVDVTLLDANDNNPTFIPSNLYEFTLSNRAQVGYKVGKVEAVDPDLGRNGMILYETKRGNKSETPSQFSVNPKTGEIRVTETPLTVGRTSLFVEASDQPANPSERRFSLAVVSIEVVSSDKVRILPDFVGAPYEFWVGDDAPIGTSIGQVRINEALDQSKVLYDLLHSYHEGVPFAIEERSGVITVVDEIGQYKNSIYDFEAVVTDELTSTLVTNVTVHVVDAQLSNIHSPSLLEYRVKENVSGAVVGTISLGSNTGIRSGRPPNHPKRPGSASHPHQRIKFSVASDTGTFAITQDGTLYTQRPLDREIRESYLVNVVAHTPRSNTHFQVHVHVEDVNDNAPVFERAWYEGRIREDCTRCEVALSYRVRATDADAGDNSEFTISLLGGDSEGFSITSQGGILFRGKLDRETKDHYTMMILARDKGNLSSQVRLTIKVDDVNDNAPVITQLLIPTDIPDLKVTSGNDSKLQVVFGNRTLGRGKSRYPAISLPETVQVGTIIAKIFATDKDSGENATVSYSLNRETAREMHVPTSHPKSIASGRALASVHFAVHPNTGEISIAARLPSQTSFLLNLTASDVGGLKDVLLLRANVEDVNDHPPIFERPFYNFSVPEGKYINKLIGKVAAKDEDFGQNGKVVYAILQKKSDNSTLPFTITDDGDIFAAGELDREQIDEFRFKILAQDNGPLGERLRSTAEVNIRITDMNDNPPLFYGYGRVIQITSDELAVLSTYPSKFEGSVALPVYFASVMENNSPGTPIARIYANDSDSQETGSGVVLYDILRKKNHRQFFAIDKEGIVTATVAMDYESQPVHNITVVASDLGTPSLSSTALLIVTVIDAPEERRVQDVPLLKNNYFELEVEENTMVPLELVKINVTRTDIDMRYLLDMESAEMFYIDPRNGTLYLMKSPDRETTPVLTAQIKVSPIKRGRNVANIIYPPNDIGWNEVKVVVRVKDMNDNLPSFNTDRRPIVIAIPTSASYGYPIIKLHATDADEGENGEVAYHLVTKGPHEVGKFSVDPMTGQVSALTSFRELAGEVFSFDVRAVDRRGHDDGLYSTANIFVYVIDDNKKLIMELGAAPYQIEPAVHNITRILSNITGLEIKMRKLEPHPSSPLTDMYLYGVDPAVNEIVDMESLNEVLVSNEYEIRRRLDPLPLHSIRLPPLPRDDQPYLNGGSSSANTITISGLEVATMALGCIVFIGAVTSAFCIICLHKRRSKSDSMSLGGGTLFSTTRKGCPDNAPRSLFFPNAFHEDSTESFQTNPAAIATLAGAYTRRSMTSRQREMSHCSHHTRQSVSHQRFKASMASVHSSSGRDSGIVETPHSLQTAPHHHHCCPCEEHISPSSETASSHGSYEDSLKSLHRNESSSESGAVGCDHNRRRGHRMSNRQGNSNSDKHQDEQLSRTASQRLLVC